MEDDHYRYRRHLDLLRSRITTGHEGQIRNDLLKIWRTCDQTYSRMDNEFVNCRRRNKISSAYLDYQEDLDALIRVLEKRLMWVNLL